MIKECDDYEVNDIVTFKVENRYLVTHRIIERNGNQFVTRGDNNNTKDNEKITKESIEGKLIYHSKLLKLLYKYSIIINVVLMILIILW